MSTDSMDMQAVLSELDRLGELKGATNKALRAGAAVVLAEAQNRAPVRTGKLKKALKIGRKASRGSENAVEVGAFYGDAPHAHLVEGGHGGPRPAPAHPFLQPAAEAKEQEVYNAIMEELKKSL